VREREQCKPRRERQARPHQGVSPHLPSTTPQQHRKASPTTSLSIPDNIAKHPWQHRKVASIWQHRKVASIWQAIRTKNPSPLSSVIVGARNDLCRKLFFYLCRPYLQIFLSFFALTSVIPYYFRNFVRILSFSLYKGSLGD